MWRGLELASRASCAERLGLIHQLDGLDATDADGGHDPAEMVRAIKALVNQPKPSEAIIPGLLDGLDKIEAITKPWMEAARRGQPLSSLVGVAAE
jgi:hypothetical protein